MRAHLPCQSGGLFGNTRSFLVGLAALLLASPGLYADIQQPPRAHAPGERRVQRRGDSPAIAVPVEAQVEQGGTTSITLRADGQVGKSIDFQIRDQPQHGTLNGGPNRLTRNSVSVVYTHTPGDEAEDDQFTYRVQAPGSAISVAETVHVRILPNPPSLVVSPLELDFGAVKAGESSRAEVTLVNRGGSEVSGTVAPPPPWIVDGPAEYHLARGASQTFQIVFRPRDEQVFADMLHLQYETAGGVRLVGTGLMDPAKAAAAKLATAAASAPTGVVGTDGGSLTVFPVVSAAPVPAVTAADTGKPALPDRTPAEHPATQESGSTGHGLTLGRDDLTSVPLNEATVRRVDVRGVSSSTVDLAWHAPTPKPASYRVELQYISVDNTDKVRVDWRPYALVDVSVGRTEVTAHLRGLPSTGLEMIRVVSVNGAGQLASPSPVVTVAMRLPSTWWRPTPLKILFALLVLCGALEIRRRREIQQMFREIDESRRARNEEAGIAWQQ